MTISSFTSLEGTLEVSRRAWAPKGMDKERWNAVVGVDGRLVGILANILLNSPGDCGWLGPGCVQRILSISSKEGFHPPKRSGTGSLEERPKVSLHDSV